MVARVFLGLGEFRGEEGWGGLGSEMGGLWEGIYGRERGLRC